MLAADCASIKKTNKMFDKAIDPDALIAIAVCDGLGKIAPREYVSYDNFFESRLSIYREYMSRPYVMGRDLVEAGIAPSSRYTDYLNYAHKLRLAGITKESALKQTISYALKMEQKLQIELYDSTMAFIKSNTKKGWRKDNDKRVELPDYPERALEEGLVNALIHRSYLQTGAHSQVDIYDDRIVITNPGGMFDGSEVQLLDIRHVPSKLRNPIIADVFGRMRLMERRGSGFKKILDAYESEERYKEELKPVFYTDGYNFFLTLWNLNYAYDKAQNKAQNKAQKSMMTDREHILLLLKENPSLTQVELSDMMNKSRRTVQLLMKELLDEGVIERIGSKKTGSWLVK